MDRARSERKVVIVGGGIAGLCAAVYARRCGYAVELLEQQETLGGLATSWRRGEYTFETCLHWLLGANPDTPMYARWQEVFDIEKLEFVYPEKFARIENERGQGLDIYADTDRMEAELLKAAPEDAAAIRHLTADIRRLAHFRMPDLSAPWPRNWLSLIWALPYLSLLRRWNSLTAEQYGRHFKHQLLRSFFGSGDLGGLSAMALAFSMAWNSHRDAGYPIGGSQAVIQAIAANLEHLGGHIRRGARVEKIVVKERAATAVRLADGEVIAADWVISAADGHATLYDLLGPSYTDRATDAIYSSLETFPSYAQISFGVARDLANREGYLIRVLDEPFMVDPRTYLSQVSFRTFNFDPTFSPRGKTPVTCFLPTANYGYWVDLYDHAPGRYRAEKNRIAETATGILERMLPGIRGDLEVVDVSTPATVVHYTGNWKGSMEGWLLAPHRAFRPLPQALPGLKGFLMAGQWVMPGGGLPSGLMTARAAIQAVCRHDRTPFLSAHPAPLKEQLT